MTKTFFTFALVSLSLCMPLCGCSDEQGSSPPAATGSDAGAGDQPASDPIENEDVKEIQE